MSHPVTKYNLSINNLVNSQSWFTRLLIRLVDKMLGISKMNKLYHLHNMQGLSKEQFADKLIALLELKIEGLEELIAKIPKEGPVVLASNHPFGGIEGVFLTRAIQKARPDILVLANKGLGIFKELQDYFIFTNPLSEKDPQNGPSLRTCIRHVKSGKALLLFPAGRVSYYQNDKNAISEHQWNKIVGRLTSIDACQYMPIFVNGTNSKWFYRLGRVYYRLRMLMLARELLNKTGAQVSVQTGNAIKERLIKGKDYQQKADFLRVLSYAFDANWHYQWPQDANQTLSPIQAEASSKVLKGEIENLPSEQKLVDTGKFEVYFAYQSQAPTVVSEIARLREIVFREHNEGSGEPLDTDRFDATYTHLFVVKKQNSQIIGAYRMGQTDNLLKNEGMEGLYLHKMFKFDKEFVNQQHPCLELGRSFLIPEFQGSYQGLLLLWKGLTTFVAKFPRYQTLYGTVSISKLYSPKSVKLIETCLIKEGDELGVKPRNQFEFDLHPELVDAHQQELLTNNLSALLCSIEHDGKDLPVLAKQYLKMGARFHALGIDKSFNHTPGLLLSVHMPSAPRRLLKNYMGDAIDGYNEYCQQNNL